MYSGTMTTTRSQTSTCTKSRVEAVLDIFLGDAVALCCRGLLTRGAVLDWVRDLVDVLVLEAVERFQIKLTLPSGTQLALDYEVFDDGRVVGSDACGGFSAHWIPYGTAVGLVIRWRSNAPNLAAARKLLADRGWGPGSMLEATGTADRTYSKDGYGVIRRVVGNWET